MLYVVARDLLEQHWHYYPVQALRSLGDLVNWGITTIFLLSVAQSPGLLLLVGLSCTAEAIRLLTEKGMMVVSAAWQVLPHGRLARRLSGTPLERVCSAYCQYYRLDDSDRLRVVLQTLKRWAATHPQTAPKLRYVNGFRIVPNETSLRCGHVRDVATGEIFVHARWTNQPGLLYGLALRRSPWIFDPRYLARPFYYRTQASRLMTLFVFENAALCPLYAIYQFGHEIKSARYDAWYRVLARLGINAEEPILADGTYAFKPLAGTLGIIAADAALHPRPLWCDEEVLHELVGGPAPSALTVATRYTYPLLYVEEVLADKIASATRDGTSQCG